MRDFDRKRKHWVFEDIFDIPYRKFFHIEEQDIYRWDDGMTVSDQPVKKIQKPKEHHYSNDPIEETNAWKIYQEQLKKCKT